MLTDTHAHIHFDQYAGQVSAVLVSASKADVGTIICVGVDEVDSAKAVEFAQRYAGSTPNIYATVGLHPHDAKKGQPALDQIARLARKNVRSNRLTPNSSLLTTGSVVAIGECGLDYYRNLSDKGDQEQAFRFQIELALALGLPMVWHVRDAIESSSGTAFDDFFKIVDQYPGVEGIVHCFTSHRANMEKAVERGFLVAFNGIMTFTKDVDQLESAKACPIQSLVLETDCPFLSPAPLRGKVNEPANIKLTAQFLAELRGEELEHLCRQTTVNANKMFGLVA